MKIKVKEIRNKDGKLYGYEGENVNSADEFRLNTFFILKEYIVRLEEEGFKTSTEIIEKLEEIIAETIKMIENPIL